jgi:D-sedoheptulose 7-phosphate isomerase
MDFVADLCEPPSALGATRRSALDLTADSSIITALTNDVGPDVVFARQIIAYGSERDVAVGFSTSGSSRNVIAAFAEARGRGLLTVCFAGYDGGRIAAERLADHVIVASSEYVPRIQEAHATAYHAIRVLIG